MSKREHPLPQLLSGPPPRRSVDGFSGMNLTEMRKLAKPWLGQDQSKLSREQLVAALTRALNDESAAKRMLSGLSLDEREVVAVYRRYGPNVDGEVIRLDLMARGLLRIKEDRITELYSRRYWQRNPVAALKDRWILRPENPAEDRFYYGFYGNDVNRPFARCSLNPRVADLVEAAGPPAWSIAPAAGVPHATTGQSPAAVALDLTRLFAYVAQRGGVKVRQSGALATPTLRALEKAVPLSDDSEIPLPDRHGLYFAILCSTGAVRIEGNTALADASGMAGMRVLSDARQAHGWARGWLQARTWYDGWGIPDTHDIEYAGAVETARSVVTWALGSLAHAGDHWYELNAFIAALDTLQGDVSLHLPYSPMAWTPELPLRTDKAEGGTGVAGRGRLGPRRELSCYANAVMATLVALGLIERGRLGAGGQGRHVFRLTPAGRTVFGAPEVAPPPVAEAGRFLVVQPNFDLLAYTDQADAASAGFLARMTESDTVRSGPIQTFRLTQASFCQAQEDGLSHDQIVAFLERHAQKGVPANVLRSLADWSGKRESLVLRTGTTLLGFPSEADRDAYLRRHSGTACGTRFVVDASPPRSRSAPTGVLIVDHLFIGRPTLEIDEHGKIPTNEPLDIVQRARLGRMARPVDGGWQITGETIRQAAAGGLKPAQAHRWLSSHLAKPMPPLIAQALGAWMGQEAPPVELADAVLLHVADNELFSAIAASTRLQPFLIGSPGRNWLIVQRDARKKLAAALEELGFTIDRQLTMKGRTQ
jgi:hypothetical protein